MPGGLARTGVVGTSPPRQSRGLTNGISFVAVKRRLTTLVVFLLLGAIVNVAVAWGCALFVDLGWTNEINGVGATALSQRPYSFVLWRGFGAIRVSAQPSDWATENGYQSLWVKPSELPLGTTLRVSQLSPGEGLMEDARGWPAMTLRCSFDVSGNPQSPWTTVAGLPVRDHATTGSVIGSPAPPFALPLRPVWPGFAINTIFYATILWLLTLGPFTARRFIRRKRGLCIKCGYDLRGTAQMICSECGWRRDDEA